VRLQDEVSGETFDLQPQVVVNAAGPWIDFANGAMGKPTNLIGGTKGSHLVLDHPELRAAIGEHEFFFENSDGRIVLICPLEHRVLVGTSDIRISDPDEAVCTDDEIAYFLGMTARVFPNIKVDQSHIVFTFSGVRPLPAADAKSTGQISRDHSIEVIEPSGDVAFPVLNLVGGKWTTFRAFAEQTTDRVLDRLGKKRRMTTATVAIGGGNAYPQTPQARSAWIERESAASGLTNTQVDQLFQRYGPLASDVSTAIVTNRAQGADQPLQHQPTYLRGEVSYLAQVEKVVHLEDFILRRSSLGMLGLLTRSLLEELSDVIGETLGWSPEERQREVAETLARLAERHRVVLP
jgi:glycerol-3-phosphate dehydrogenase